MKICPYSRQPGQLRAVLRKKTECIFHKDVQQNQKTNLASRFILDTVQLRTASGARNAPDIACQVRGIRYHTLWRTGEKMKCFFYITTRFILCRINLIFVCLISSSFFFSSFTPFNNVPLFKKMKEFSSVVNFNNFFVYSCTITYHRTVSQFELFSVVYDFFS